MRFSYYTIDDLRLGHDPRGVTGWRLSQFLHWRDALEHYRSLPDSQVKEVGPDQRNAGPAAGTVPAAVPH